MPGIWMRIRELFRGPRLDGELDEEVGLHLQMMEEEFQRRGMSEAEARAAARREFGGVAHAKEAYRDQRGFPWIESFGKDVRYALRGLRRSPGFTAAAVVSLALGIGANTAIFSLFHTLMLRMLPVAHAEQLVWINRTGGWGRGTVSVPLYRELAGRADLFNGVIASNGVQKVSFTPPRAPAENTRNENMCRATTSRCWECTRPSDGCSPPRTTAFPAGIRWQCSAMTCGATTMERTPQCWGAQSWWTISR